jgi:hypothetical protein
VTELTPEEKSRIYQEEKARLEAQARLHREEKEKFRPGCGTIVLICAGIIVIFYAVGTWFNSRSAVSVSVPEIKKPETHALSYEVLRSWTPGRSGTGLELLVSPTASKSEVMQLAHELMYEYAEYGQEVISIFDSREAWANRGNGNYPETAYWKHFLVSIFNPPLPGDERVKWVAEGRTELTTTKR